MTKPKQVEVKMDRRNSNRRKEERRKEAAAVVVERRQGERRVKVPRRRQIDPTTCERDYSADEIEFMHALDAYKRTSGRMFPTCSEILEVIRALGYARAGGAEAVEVCPPAAEQAEPADVDLIDDEE